MYCYTSNNYFRLGLTHEGYDVNLLKNVVRKKSQLETPTTKIESKDPKRQIYICLYYGLVD
jgi:arylamine N-acetyltransferase